MKLSRQTIATAGCLALFLLLGGARVAEAGIEVFPNPVAVAVGEESEVEVKCTGCDYPPTGFGVLIISIDDVNIASGFPQDGEEFIITSQPPTPIRSIFRNITGVSEGTTILRVKLFRAAETIPILEEEVTINVSPGSGCPVALLLDEDREQDDTLATLRLFRDDVMGQSATGRAYTRQFSRHAFEVSLILLGDPALFEEVRETLLATLPTIEAVVNGERAMLTAENQVALDAVLDALQANASLPLQRTIHELRSDLHNGKRLRALGIEVERGR